MNSKFFDVNKEKQDNIINAALRIFAAKGYKDASTDVIVKAAGISKGLLFHYFESKKGLYEFICDYSSKYMILELTRAVKSTEKDFFNIFSQIEIAKTRVLRNYPYMQQFLRSLPYEKDEEAISQFGESLSNLEKCYNNIYDQINPKNFIDPSESKKVIDMINWINDGYVKQCLQDGITSADEIQEGFAKYLDTLKKHYYKSDIDETITLALEEDIVRNEDVMDDLKMEMTFEERLQAGKRPLVDLPEGEEAEAVNDSDGDSSDDESSEGNSSEDNKADGQTSEAGDNSNKESVDNSTASESTSVEESSLDVTSASDSTEAIAADGDSHTTDINNDQDSESYSSSPLSSIVIPSTSTLTASQLNGYSNKAEVAEEDFFDTEDDESGEAAKAEEDKKNSPGEILNFPTSGSSESSYRSGNIDEIIREAENNLKHEN